MKIAVCEDCVTEREQLCEKLKAAMDSLGLDAEIAVFGDAEELLEAAGRVFFSVIFLDILLPGMSGMDAALKLRRRGNYSPVVFTTMTNDYRAQSYSVWAASYLVKPVGEREVAEALSQALKALEGKERRLEITVARHTEYIPYSDIYYIKGSNRTCCLHTRTGTYTPYVSIQGLLETLGDDRFFCSHRSYVINLDHVLMVQRGKVAMRSDELLPIRRGGTEAVLRAWEDRRFALVGGRE